MKFKLRGASGVALMLGMALPAWAQQPAAPTASQVDQVKPAGPADAATPGDKVVITGSYIAGTPEDAALPVEVYSQKELEEQGSPTALEFAKSLSIAGPTTGEAYYFSGAQLTGSVSYNLRGIGADKTLTLLNGRRMSANTSNIPSAALARTEILKDGAATIYGADAIGGVVNFITRDKFVGFEAKGQYKVIDGSDGDYGLSLLGGIGSGDTNFLWSAEWEHRSRLSTTERDFSKLPYYINPSPWSTLTNVASWLPRGALPANPSPFFNGAMDASGEFGTPTAGLVKDFTPASCAAFGGVYNPNGVAAGIPACAYGYAPYYNLVEQNDIYRAYAQLNSRINDHMDFHFEATYGEVMSPKVFGSPAQPVIRGPGLTAAATYQFYVPTQTNANYAANPFAAAFMANSGLSAGVIGATQGLTALTYRAFAHGGNDSLGGGDGYGVPSRIDNQVWRVSAGLKGELGDWAGMLKDVGYDFAVTYNQSTNYGDAADVVGFRLQEALAGFGGPACNAADLNPNRNGTQNPGAAGKNGCQFWNPFASNFASQPVLGLANPGFVSTAKNPVDLERWIFDTRGQYTLNSNLNVDLVFNSETPIQLPGGAVGLAVGGQIRELEARTNVTDPLYNGMTPCEWPTGETPLPVGNPADPNNKFNGCTPDSPGPFVFFGTQPNTSTDQQEWSVFTEASVPLLDNLNFQLAARHEVFSHGLDATVYKVSGKWDVWGPISVRGAYGTNYQAPPVGLTPGQIVNGVNSYTKVAGAWLGAQTQTQTSVTPSTAKTANLGLIWSSKGFTSDADLRIIVDYFDIKTEKEIGLLASVNDIAAVVFPGVNTGTALANCSSPFISRVSFNSGTCIQGVTSARDFSSIRTDFGNGPGQHTAGIDIQADYTMPVGPGDLSLGLTATEITKFFVDVKTLDGVALDAGDNKLGTLNFATIANATPKWRANANVNYKWDKMNFRFVTNFISGVRDERFDAVVATAGCPTNTQRGYTDLSTVGGIGCTNYGSNPKDWLTFDFFWTWDVLEDLRLGASIQNITDRDPPQAREELGYDPRMGNPLGRTFEVSLKKSF